MKRLLIWLLPGSLFACLCAGRTLAQGSDTSNTAHKCNSWSTKFDNIDDEGMLRILRAHQKEGWESLLKEGEALGISAATQIVDGERQLEKSRLAAERDQEILEHLDERPFPKATAKDCVDVEARGVPWMKTACDLHKRQNETLAVGGMLDLLKCNTTKSGPALPAGLRVVASFTVHVVGSASDTANSKPKPQLPGLVAMPVGRIVEVGPDQAAKGLTIAVGESLLLRFPNATGVTVEPTAGVLELPKGIYNLPKDATGLARAVGSGSAIVTILGSVTAQPAGKPAGGNPADAISTNWSDYIAPGQNLFFASGQWQVPQLWGFGNRASATWVGIDGTGTEFGLNDSTLLQAGTVQESNAGFLGIGESQDYWAFWEVIPLNAAQHIPFNVSPGDTMHVSLRSLNMAKTVASNSNVWEIIVNDSTQNWTFEQLIDYKGLLAHVDWVEEAPTSCFLVICNIETLANYQSVTFDDGSILPGVPAPAPSFNPSSSPLSVFPPTAFRPGFPALLPSESDSLGQNNVIVSTPSNPDGDGDGFTLAFGASMPPPPGPFITTTTLPLAELGAPFSHTLAVSGATSPKWFNSQLPPGLSLDSTTGVISGTPTSKGTFGIGVWVADSANSGELSQLQHLDLTVAPSYLFVHCKFYPGLQKTICW